MVILLLFVSSAYAKEKIVRIAADPWCPYNCNPEEVRQGMMVDVAREALSLSGYKLEYSLLNWARAKSMVRRGDLDGIVGMTLSPDSAPLYVFPETALGLSQLCFFKRTDDDWRYEGATTLSGKIVGWINGFGIGGEPELDRWIKDNQKSINIVIFSGNHLQERLLKTLIIGRIDTFIEDRNVIAYQMKQDNLLKKVNVAGCVSGFDNVHVAFSKAAPEAERWANAIDIGVAKMRENGKLAEILTYYGLTPDNWLTP